MTNLYGVKKFILNIEIWKGTRLNTKVVLQICVKNAKMNVINAIFLFIIHWEITLCIIQGIFLTPQLFVMEEN